MAAILVDYENVGNANGLRGVDVLQETDTLVIFYSGCCGKIRYDYMQEIKYSGCRFKVVKLKEAGKNALDFYIASECGGLRERGEKQIAIISNDKGFQAVIDFFQMDAETKKVQVVRAGNIETALTFLPCQRRIRELLQGTAYTERTAEIIDFIDERKNCEKKEWYTGSLHRFGRKDGTVIYRLLKNGINHYKYIANANEKTK